MTTPNHPNNILFPATSIVAVEETGPRTITSAEGVWVTDDQGKRVLDGIAGLWCANVGHGRTEIAEVASQAITKLDFFHTFNGHTNEALTKLSNRMCDLAPSEVNHVFFGCTGSDANDTLIKLAWLYHATRGNPERTKVIAREQAYHGTSISTGGLTGLAAFHKSYPIPEPWVVRIGCPHYWRYSNDGETEEEFTNRLAQELEETIQRENPETIAAFIGEPILGAGGVIPPPAGYWDKVQEICKRHGILLIADEVVSGFGRTGSYFASEDFNIEPDFMTVAKGITSGIFPLSGAMISDHVYDVLRESSQEIGGFFHGYTYSGHPVGAAIANKVLDIIEDEDLVGNAKTNGDYLHEQLQAKVATHPQIGEVRGKGLLAGVQILDADDENQIVDPTTKTAKAISLAAYEEGVIVRPLHTTSSMALSPPLNITTEEIDILVNGLAAAVKKVLG